MRTAIHPAIFSDQRTKNTQFFDIMALIRGTLWLGSSRPPKISQAIGRNNQNSGVLFAVTAVEKIDEFFMQLVICRKDIRRAQFIPLAADFAYESAGFPNHQDPRRHVPLP